MPRGCDVREQLIHPEKQDWALLCDFVKIIWGRNFIRLLLFQQVLQTNLTKYFLGWVCLTCPSAFSLALVFSSVLRVEPTFYPKLSRYFCIKIYDYFTM